MISASDFQRIYVKIYKRMREYIWDFDVVDALSDFEVSVYRLFPDIYEIEKKFNDLRRIVDSYELDDPDMDKYFDKFQELLDSDDSIYYAVTTFREVIDNEDSEI